VTEIRFGGVIEVLNRRAKCDFAKRNVFLRAYFNTAR